MTINVARVSYQQAAEKYAQHLRDRHGNDPAHAPFNYYCAECYELTLEMVKCSDDVANQRPWRMM
jgi:hypothetical protein